MTQRRTPFPITAYAWSNTLGTRHVVDASVPTSSEWALMRKPLPRIDETLSLPGLPAIPGHWGICPGPLAALPSNVRRHESRCTRLLFTTLRPLSDAIARAVNQYGAERVGLVLGSSTGGIDVTEIALAEERDTGSLSRDYDFESLHAYDALIRSIRGVTFIEGPAYVVSTACSSSGKSIAAAQRLIDAGVCDAVITGGADALCQMTLRGFRSLGILSTAPCRPFDGARDGITIGEGSALLLLEREGRGISYVLGAGESADAYHATAPHPEGLGARLAMRQALESAGLEPDEVGYVNAHGTGTRKNDQAEALALSTVLGPRVSYSSTKDRTGHQLGAAGGTEALFCLETMRFGRAPENRPPDVIDRQLAVAPMTASTPRESGIRATLSNSFAFGGSNVTLALGASRGAIQAPTGALPGCVYVTKMGFWASGHPDFESFEAGERAGDDKPAATLLPARARGRSSLLTRLFAELLARVDDPEAPPLGSLPVVFASAYGEMTTTLSLLDQMLTQGELSPARFQASVHNTAAGQLSIATENRAFSTALAAGADTTAMALVEATSHLLLQGGEIAVLLADEEAPRRVLRGKNYPALGVGFRLRLATEAPPGALAAVSVVRETGSKAPIAPSGPLDSTWKAHPLFGSVHLLRALRQRLGQVALGGGWVAQLTPVSR